MAQIWKEKLNPDVHRDYMQGYQDAGGRPVQPPRDSLIEAWVYFARSGRFQLQFTSQESVEEAIRYFSRKTHPARREPNVGLEHYWQRWFERLPPGIHKDPARTKMLNTLEDLKKAIIDGTLSERKSPTV